MKFRSVKRGAQSKRSKMGKRPIRARRNKKRKSGTVRVKTLGIPHRMIVKMPYTDVGQYATDTGYYVQKSYNVNNVWDPETGVLNDSALWVKEYSNIYEKFRVFAVSYDVVLINGNTSAPSFGSLCFAEQGNGPDGNAIQSFSMPFSRPFTLSYSGAHNTVRLKGKMSLPKVLGMTSEQYRTNDRFVGTLAGSNPATMIQMVITNRATNGSASNLIAHVKLTYHLELFDRVRVLYAPGPSE